MLIKKQLIKFYIEKIKISEKKLPLLNYPIHQIQQLSL